MQFEGSPQDDAVLRHIQSIKEKLSCGPGGDLGGLPDQQGDQQAPPWPGGAARSDLSDQKDQDMFRNLRELFQKQTNEHDMLMNIKEEEEEEEEDEESQDSYVKSEDHKQPESYGESKSAEKSNGEAKNDTKNAHPESDEEKPGLNPALKNTDTPSIKTEPTNDN